jgi:hypothetical protein
MVDFPEEFGFKGLHHAAKIPPLSTIQLFFGM